MGFPSVLVISYTIVNVLVGNSLLHGDTARTVFIARMCQGLQHAFRCTRRWNGQCICTPIVYKFMVPSARWKCAILWCLSIILCLKALKGWMEHMLCWHQRRIENFSLPPVLRFQKILNFRKEIFKEPFSKAM